MNRSSVLLKIYIFFSVFDILPQKFVVSTFNKEILNYVQQTTELSDSVTDFGFIYASLVKNLTVNVRVFRMGSRKKLQLYISWIKPTEGRIPDNYNLHVFPSNTSLNDHCGDEVYYGFIRDPEITNWSVPEYSQLKINGLHDGLTILPECTYYVTLESNPHNGKLASRSMFTVPDCVEDICSCRFSKKLPEPLVNVKKIAVDTINVTWSVVHQSNLNRNVSFIIGLGERMTTSRNFKGIYNMSWLKEIRAANEKYKYYTLLVLPKKNHGNFMAAVQVLDSKRCLGPSGNITFEVDHIQDENSIQLSRSEVIWLTVLPTMACVGVICTAGILAWKKSLFGLNNRRYHGELSGRVRHVTNFRPTYKSLSVYGTSTSRMILPSLQERNILYVEKEIEDAKAKGEADNFEISYSRIILGKEIGKGAFGRVFLAQAEAIGNLPGFTTVAVKKLKYKATPDELEEFQAEIAMMKKVGRHPNIVNIIGCCTISQPYCMLMEYIPCGDLLQYLRQLRHQVKRPLPSVSSKTNISSSSRSSESSSYVEPDNGTLTSSLFSSENPLLNESSLKTSKCFDTVPKLEYVLDPRELQSFAFQIANGMSHLESKHITHRDLAARNILVDKNKTLKISDFGLSRTGIYVNTKHKKVPLRWLSIEAMRDSLYSSKSDVWAFGIVLWEIGTLGGFPYPTVVDYELLNYLLQGNRLEKPANCSDELYSLMIHCWSHSADARPTFQQLVTCLDTSISNKRVYVNFDDLQNYIILPPTEQQPVPKITSPSETKT